MLTALSVARDCEMIAEEDRVIIVSARPPPPPTPDSHTPTPAQSVDGNDTGGEQKANGGPTLPAVAIATEAHAEQASTSSGEDGHDSDMSWFNLVQFHYAEDLHRPVTEVATARKTKRPKKVRLEQDDSSSSSSSSSSESSSDGESGDDESSSDEEESSRPVGEEVRVRRGLAKWLPFV